MIFNNCKSLLAANLHQIPGWKTNRKIVVFESDDWGSIRMPSSKTYKELKNRGFKLNSHYNKLDCLETTSDLEALFEVLLEFKDINGMHPSITANWLVANPDFESIRVGNFKTYYYELFTEAYRKNQSRENSFPLIQKAMSEGIIRPQFHGREHLNVCLWMNSLQQNHSETLVAFSHGFWGFSPTISNSSHFLSAYDIHSENDKTAIKEIICDGLRIFETIFGYRSESFIATNYTWHPDFEKTLYENGVRYIQGQRKQLIPKIGKKGYFKKWRFTGQLNKWEQVYLVRNVFFEPSENPTLDYVGRCINEISTAFFWKKPAIISCHRVNFIGALDPINNSVNLLLLKKLISKILKLWPDVEFMTSDGLGRLISEG
jgi:hypothetical protein